MNILLKSASRGLTIAASLLFVGGVWSFIKGDEQTKSIAMNIALVSASTAVTTELTSRSNHRKANEQLADFMEGNSQEWQKLNYKFEQQTKVLNETENLRDELQKGLESAVNDVLLQRQINSELQTRVATAIKNLEEKSNELDAKIGKEDMRYQEVISTFKGLVTEHLNERIVNFLNGLKSQIAIKLEDENFSSIHQNLIIFHDKLHVSYDNHKDLLLSIKDIDGDLEDIVNDTLQTFTRIVDEQHALKVKFRNLLTIDERRSLDEAFNLIAEFEEVVTDLNHKTVPKDKAKEAIKEYSDFQQNQLINLSSQVNDNKNSLEEMRAQVQDLINQIEKLALEKLELQKPQKWVLATSRELQIGNMVIDFFASKGFHLDRSHSDGDEFSTKLYFQTDRNPRAILAKELQEHSEPLAIYCRCLKIDFEFNNNIGLMVATVQLREKPKEDKNELSDAAINRVARSWDTWKKPARKWNRIRITGGSGAGKSPLTERLVSEILQYKKAGLEAIKLYNPMADSRKDFWSFLSVGRNHRDCLNGIAELTSLCSRKYRGAFGIWVFDEIDSSLKQAPPKARPTKDDPEPEPTASANILSIITQIDHTTQAVFLLGQGANTGKIPNTTKGDWNNLVGIHILGNAKDYLRLAEHIDTSSKDRLNSQADLLQKYCDSKNEQLGLERTEPGAYRYALIDEYGEKQYFVMLPLFSADEFLESLSTNTKNEVFTTKSNELTLSVAESVSKVENRCPTCGGNDIGSKGDRWRCKAVSCGKTWTKDK
ncbi:MAG: hypothetical protein KME22_09305 [Hassallia sp. WJT32-NPBG1]|jgi:ribosomal protein S27AE/adenosyl cobinamide kinase/adenosyl cobinamide phosphate guanylyltransferase|nr:hypothetical protein [Hassallia sp. WJT32-NPBG1]